MKRLIFLFLFFFFLLAISANTYSQPLGGKNGTVEVLGGLKPDSAFQLPYVAPFANKGIDSNRRIYVKKTDTLPYYMKNGVEAKIYTSFDIPGGSIGLNGVLNAGDTSNYLNGIKLGPATGTNKFNSIKVYMNADSSGEVDVWDTAHNYFATIGFIAGGPDFQVKVGQANVPTKYTLLSANNGVLVVDGADYTQMTKNSWQYNNGTYLFQDNYPGSPTGSHNYARPDFGGTYALSDHAQSWSGGQAGIFTSLSYASTLTPDFSVGNNFKVQLTGNVILGTPSNLVAGQSGIINIRQDSIGSRLLSSASWVWDWPGGTLPTLTTTAYAKDMLVYNVNSYSTSTVTMTIATPCVVTWTGHNMMNGTRVQFTTTGALPTGLSASTTYWVHVIDANTFNISSSLANLQSNTYVNTSGSQSGVQTAVNASVTGVVNLDCR